MKHDVICPACEENIEIEYDSDPEEPETWGYNGGTPYIPASIDVFEQSCEYCGHYFTQKERDLMEQQIHNSDTSRGD